MNKPPGLLALVVRIINLQRMIKKAAIFTFLLLVTAVVMAQVPSGIPSGTPEPLELTLTNIIVFIVLPVIIVILYIYWRRKKRK